MCGIISLLDMADNIAVLIVCIRGAELLFVQLDTIEVDGIYITHKHRQTDTTPIPPPVFPYIYYIVSKVRFVAQKKEKPGKSWFPVWIPAFTGSFIYRT